MANILEMAKVHAIMRVLKKSFVINRKVSDS